MAISETLQYFREGMLLSKKEFCEGILSSSYYSKVESGHSNISADLLLELLRKNNISSTEFFLKVNNSQEDQFIVSFEPLMTKVTRFLGRKHT
ncbi:helix-turn-helix transcriptional regulator [Vagococcus sp. BWB3-3]|uniref:Helix-turn-helix transcriptional regulator n=1 Tax=Vagococcus allomyrinae TaxID=2794353 RepID=A0A940SVI5_9ENTE|nr:helix-turn-helix transcriptional regulator [Vagococcus allomyrinae]MBP1041894.1 helix-turn-helix transcriptional regulator [Vagococcus allomyrinae]